MNFLPSVASIYSVEMMCYGIVYQKPINFVNQCVTLINSVKRGKKVSYVPDAVLGVGISWQ